ncbi:hypothetical protein Hte_008117 [Hypoxylon texense]
MRISAANLALLPSRRSERHNLLPVSDEKVVYGVTLILWFHSISRRDHVAVEHANEAIVVATDQLAPRNPALTPVGVAQIRLEDPTAVIGFVIGTPEARGGSLPSDGIRRKLVTFGGAWGVNLLGGSKAA